MTTVHAATATQKTVDGPSGKVGLKKYFYFCFWEYNLIILTIDTLDIKS